MGSRLGELLHVGGSALGMSAFVPVNASVFTASKLADTAYPIWLGVRAIAAARGDALALVAEHRSTPTVGGGSALREASWPKRSIPRRRPSSLPLSRNSATRPGLVRRSWEASEWLPSG